MTTPETEPKPVRYKLVVEFSANNGKATSVFYEINRGRLLKILNDEYPQFNFTDYDIKELKDEH